VSAKRESGSRVDETRGVFMISVAAELAEMHPQTLRMYEARGLITPKRSPKNTRLYSQADVERLRRIQRLTSEEGLNLAGVETVLEMEQTVARMRKEMARMRRRADEMEKRMLEELERARSALGGELVPYGAYEPVAPRADDGGDGDSEGTTPVSIRRSRRRRRR
jgi:MerR family transcriptional regulator/heat shock protein HspR